VLHFMRRKASTRSVIYKDYVTMEFQIVNFWVVTLCGLICRYQCFRGVYCLHFQGAIYSIVGGTMFPLKCFCPPNVDFHKTKYSCIYICEQSNQAFVRNSPI
jgi:hypothetical protein